MWLSVMKQKFTDIPKNKKNTDAGFILNKHLI